MPRLIESDVPKVMPTEVYRFFAFPGLKPLELVKDKVTWYRDLPILSFFVVNRTPLPFLSSVSARLFTAHDDELWTDKRLEIIGPFATDEWQLVGLDPTARTVSLRLGVFPFEIALSELTVEMP